MGKNFRIALLPHPALLHIQNSDTNTAKSADDKQTRESRTKKKIPKLLEKSAMDTRFLLTEIHDEHAFEQQVEPERYLFDI